MTDDLDDFIAEESERSPEFRKAFAQAEGLGQVCICNHPRAEHDDNGCTASVEWDPSGLCPGPCDTAETAASS